MPARRRHRRPRPGPPREPFVLEGLDLLAPPPARPDPHWGVPPVLWAAWRAAAGGPLAGPARRTGLTAAHHRHVDTGDQPPFDWPAAHADLHRHLLLPAVAATTGHHVEVAALGTRVVATHLDGRALRVGDPTGVLRARQVLTGHRRVLDPAEVLAYALVRDDLAARLGPALTAPDPARPDPGLDLALVLAAARAGLSGAEIADAHRAGTLDPERIALLTALLRPS
ncbi:hypothetical protein [Kineococcus radiotolerans]|uniref:Uncharacterized protein n=1 Tax=Kineococcus radiotolerans (strain ATCC BAA-149 / DSM 14245 / SRS30216) TaxID=266940 RepID=A6W908_KINRD|nr:hypothetical protein [Kineococcus radiotolerans]ABS03297.1 hypothetical protein Krad_1811 [Kineococcus radiotolerans SRS30216 = ATCC BAA-149]